MESNRLIINAIGGVIALIILTRILTFLSKAWRVRAWLNRLQNQGKVSVVYPSDPDHLLTSHMIAHGPTQQDTWPHVGCE